MSLTAAERTRIIGAALASLADRIEGSESPSLVQAHFTYLIAELRATKLQYKQQTKK